MNDWKNSLSVNLNEKRDNTKAKLDPAECRGKNFFYNILESLGVNEKILDNPLAIGDIEHFCKGFLDMSGFKYDLNNPTSEQIRLAIASFGVRKILDEEERATEWRNRSRWCNSSQCQVYKGVQIDENGNISLQHLSGNINQHGCECEERMSYSIDENGNVVYSSYTIKDINTEGKGNLSSKWLQKYSRDGKVIEREIIEYSIGKEKPDDPDREPFELGQIIRHTKKTRDPKNSLVAKMETLVNDGEALAEPDIRYGFINPTSIYMGIAEKDGKKIEGTREAIFEYIKENKEAIRKWILRAMTNFSLLGQSAKWRVNQLSTTAKEAGIELEKNKGLGIEI